MWSINANRPVHIALVISSLNWVISLFTASDISSTCLWVAVLLDAPMLPQAWLQVEVPSTPKGAHVWNNLSPRLLMRMKLCRVQHATIT